MPQTNVLSDGAQVASFTPHGGQLLELHQQLHQITDSRGPRVVIHEFPNRDGAKPETLGRRPHKTQWSLTFTGVTWRQDFLTLVQAIDDFPAGLLIHPIYGQMNVVCQGFDHSLLNIAESVDTITFELTFIEDQLDLGVVQQQGAAAKQQAVTTASDDFNTAAAPYSDVNTRVAIQALISQAALYADAAYTAITTAVLNPALGQLLNNVATSLTTVEAAILVDSHGLNTAATYDAIAAAAIVYSAALDLADEVALETAGFRTLVLAGDTSIAALAAVEFGPRALSVIDQILQLNPAITDPTRIVAGTQILLPV